MQLTLCSLSLCPTLYCVLLCLYSLSLSLALPFSLLLSLSLSASLFPVMLPIVLSLFSHEVCCCWRCQRCPCSTLGVRQPQLLSLLIRLRSPPACSLTSCLSQRMLSAAYLCNVELACACLKWLMTTLGSARLASSLLDLTWLSSSLRLLQYAAHPLRRHPSSKPSSARERALSACGIVLMALNSSAANNEAACPWPRPFLHSKSIMLICI